MARLFVGNLDRVVSDIELGDLFKEFGTVRKAEVVRGRGGKGRGFGYVELTTDEETARALASLNGRELHGRPLTLAEARSQARIKPMDDQFNGPPRGRPSYGRRRG